MSEQPPATGSEPAPLPPGAGSPIVPGPPKSVSGPIRARGVNLFFGVGAVVVIVAAIVIVIILAIAIINAIGHH